MLRIALRGAWGTRRRLAGTALAVVLGVAFLTGTLVLGDTLRANFDDLFAETTAGTDAVVRNPTTLSRGDAMVEEGSFVDASVVDTVAGVDGVEQAVGQVQGYAALIGDDGEAIGGNGPPRLASNWVDDPDLNPYRLVEGRAPEADDEVVVNRGAAESGGLALGDRVTVQTPAVVLAAMVIETSRIGGWLERALLFVLGPIAASFLHLLLTYKCEYAADRVAAGLCGSPHGLADALIRLEQTEELFEFAASPATEPLYTVNPFAEEGLAALFVTHPPVADRVRRLRTLDPSWREKLRAA